MADQETTMDTEHQTDQHQEANGQEITDDNPETQNDTEVLQHEDSIDDRSPIATDPKVSRPATQENLNGTKPPAVNFLPEVSPPRVKVNKTRHEHKTEEIVLNSRHRQDGGFDLPELSPRKAELGRIPSPSAAEKREREKRMKMLQATRPKLPNNAIRMARVAMTSRDSRRPTAMKEHATYIDQERARGQKVVTWDEANNCRPPLRIDMDTPGPTVYTPRNKPLREDNSPHWSFGRRTFVEKEGGSRTAWEKTWFQSPHIYQQKTDFYSDRRWPAPTYYRLRPAVGRQTTTDMITAPSFTLGNRRSDFCQKQGSEMEPAPNDYETARSFNSSVHKGPAFTVGLRRGGTYIWNNKEYTPGPGYYSPDLGTLKTSYPSFSIQGERRSKSHVYGPFATL